MFGYCEDEIACGWCGIDKEEIEFKISYKLSIYFCSEECKELWLKYRKRRSFRRSSLGSVNKVITLLER